jgi:hypothetical protein
MNSLTNNYDQQQTSNPNASTTQGRRPSILDVLLSSHSTTQQHHHNDTNSSSSSSSNEIHTTIAPIVVHAKPPTVARTPMEYSFGSNKNNRINDSPSSTKTTTKRRRAANACSECRKAHKKCSKERPCTRCRSLNVDCVDNETAKHKRGRPNKWSTTDEIRNNTSATSHNYNYNPYPSVTTHTRQTPVPYYSRDPSIPTHYTASVASEPPQSMYWVPQSLSQLDPRKPMLPLMDEKINLPPIYLEDTVDVNVSLPSIKLITAPIHPQQHRNT